MKKRSRWVWLLLLIVALALYVWLSRPRGAAQEQQQREQQQDAALIFDRLWVDAVAQDERAFVHGFVVLRKLPLGAFQRASAYRLEAERFDYRVRGGALDLRFPQSETEGLLRYRIRSCRELPPHDLCLDVLGENPWGGPLRYYATREQRRSGAEARLRGLLAE